MIPRRLARSLRLISLSGLCSFLGERQLKAYRSRSRQRSVFTAKAWRLRLRVVNSFLPLALATLFCVTQVSGQQRSDPSVAMPHFIRMYAPLEVVERWPAKLLPMDRAEFERHAAQLKPEALQTSPSRPRIVRAAYSATLQGDALIDGQAVLQIDHPQGGAALLVLSPWSLATAGARWQAAQGTAADQAPTTDDPITDAAKAGAQAASREVTLGADASGRLSAVVDTSGSLDLSWSLRRRPDPGERLVFDFDLPACPVSLLTLDLPAQRVPYVRGAVVSEIPAAAAPATPLGSRPASRRRWRLELGGRHRFELTIGYRPDALRSRRLTLARQMSHYELMPGGINITTTISLDVHHEPLRQLHLATDPGLRIVSVRRGTSSVPWEVAADESHVVLRFAEPVQGTNREITISAIAPLETGRPWQLPRMVPTGLFWQEGLATLTAAEPLSIDALEVTGGQQARALSAGAVTLRYFDPQATVRLLIGFRQDRPRLSSAMAIDIDDETTTAQLIAELRIERGYRSRIEAIIGKGWIIDSVTSSPEGAVANWHVESDKGPSRLKIQLDPIRPGEPRRLLIAGRHRGLSPGQRVAAGGLTTGQLKMLQFQDVDVVREVVSVAAGSRFRLHLEGDEQLSRLDQFSPGKQDALLPAGRQAELLFLLGPHSDQLRIGLERARPQFHGQLRVELTAGEHQLDWSYKIRCVPNNEPLGHVAVHFSHARDETLRWSISSDGENILDVDQFTARRITGREKVRAGLDEGGETWVVQLKQPLRSPFTIAAHRTSVFTSKQPVALAVLPEATSQTGRVSVRAAGGNPPTIYNRRLAPLMSLHGRVDETTSLRGAFRYDPLSDATSEFRAALSLGPSTSETPLPSAWAYDCRLQTLLASDGTTRHVALYAIENAGRRSVAVTMPQGVRLLEARIGGVATRLQTIASASKKIATQPIYSIELPATVRFPSLSLHYSLPGAGLSHFSKVASLAPKLDIPVLSRSWICWIPPGYQLLDRCATAQARLSWSERLFGPFGRPVTGQAFNLFSPTDYVGPSPHSKELSALDDHTATLLDRLRRVIAADRVSPRDGRLTWGQWLTQAAPQTLIDTPALRDLGLSPNSPVKLAPAADKTKGSSAGGVLSLIERAGLVLLIHPRAVVLTSATQGSLAGRQIVALPRFAAGDRATASVFRLLPGSLADRLERATNFGGDWGYVSANTWNAIGDDNRLPWSPADRDRATQTAWPVYRIDLQGERPVEARVVRVASLQMLAWCLGLIVAALFWSRLGNRPITILVIATAAATAALLTPAPYLSVVPIFSGVLIGSITALLLRTLTARRVVPTDPANPADPADPADQSTKTLIGSLAQTLGIFLLAVTVSITASAAIGAQEKRPGSSGDTTKQEPAIKKTKPKQKSFRVFFPIDDKKKPVGDKVFVPEALYEQMLRRSALVQNEPSGPLIESAIYRTVLDWEDDQTSLGVVDLSAEFNLHVFDASRAVRLAIAQPSDNGPARPIKLTSVRLDGWPLQPDAYRPLPGGRALLLMIDQPGKHRITLSWQPCLTSGDRSTGFDIDVPPVATARVELALPADAPAILIPTRRGRLFAGESPGQWVAHLGPSSRLSVRWPQDATPGSGKQIEIEQLLLLSAEPGAVRLTDRVKYRVVNGVAREIVLQLDPRLRLLPFDQNSPVKSSHRLPDDPASIVLELADPTKKQGVIDVHFLLDGTHGVGKLRLPHIGQQSSRQARRYLAVVVDDELEVEVPPASGVEPIAAAEFSNLWGSPLKQPPKLAYRIAPEEVDWSMSSRHALPQTDVDQTLTLRLRHRKVRFDYQADLSIASGHVLRYRVTLPRNIEVDRVTLSSSGGNDLVAHWRQHDNDRLTLFLREPIRGKHRLAIRASRVLGASGRMPLATFRIEGAHTRKRRYRLYRGERVLLSVDNLKGLSSVLPPSGAATADTKRETQERTEKTIPQEDDRLVADLVAKDPHIAATLIYSPNRPLIDAVAVTSMQRADDGSWNVRFDYQVKVTDGLVDQLRFVLPAAWSGPPVLDSPAAWRLEKVPGQQNRRLIIRLDHPIQGLHRLSFHGPIARSAELRVPLVKPLGNSALRHFLVLPTQILGRPIAWNLRRVTPRPLPEDFQQSTPATDSSPTDPRATYLMGDDAEVTLDSEAPSSGSPRVRLADIHLQWNHDRSCTGVAIFDLQPAGRSSCLLRMPPALRIIHASIQDAAALMTPAGKHSWRIPLVSREHPQRIQILFSGTLPPSDAAGRIVDLVAPSLNKLPVERTLWTVHGPHDDVWGYPAWGRPLSTTADIGTLPQQLIRIKAIGQMLAAEQSSPNETSPIWKHAWTHRLRRASDLFESQSRHVRLADEDEMKQEARLVEQSLLEQGLLAARPSYLVARTADQGRFPHVFGQLDAVVASHAARLLIRGEHQWAFEVPADQAGPLRESLRELAPATTAVWQITHSPPMATTIDRLWNLSQAARQPATRLMFKGPKPRIQIVYPPQPWATMPPHALLAALLVALSIGAAVVLRRRAVVEAVVVRPHLLGVVAGLLWWLFLWPSWFGWVVIAVSLFASVRVEFNNHNPTRQ